MAVYNIHGGHNPAGKIACGASDLLDESREDRKICKEVVKLLKKKGHKAYNCTVSNGTSQNDVLNFPVVEYRQILRYHNVRYLHLLGRR